MATERAENVLKKQIADSDLHFYFHPVLPLRVSLGCISAWVTRILVSRGSAGCVVSKTYRIVHTRACLREVGIALDGAQRGWRRRGVCGEMDRQKESTGVGWVDFSGKARVLRMRYRHEQGTFLGQFVCGANYTPYLCLAEGRAPTSF